MSIERYRDRTRINHWIVVLLFLSAGLTGFSLFHPALFFLSSLFGGGTWSRILHPFFGLVTVIGFFFLFMQVWRDNVWNKGDSEWMRKSPLLLRGDEDSMPPVGKYNGAQKAIFWLFATCLVLLLVTGFTFWRPWFADAFPIPVRRLAVLIHSASAFILILGLIIHVYAAIWVKGSVQAMTQGRVSESWARRHHALWAKEVSGEK